MIIQSAPLVSLKSPISVSLSEVEAQLTKIWADYQTANPDGAGATRASTFTLIVYEPEETQHLLAQLGYYGGPIDGIGGPRMEAAIYSAQTAYGLPSTGKGSAALLQKLRHELAVCRGEVDEEGSACSISDYTKDAAGAGIADAIASQNPCRIIALFPTIGMDEGVSAQVSVYCPVQKQDQGALICCEYITLRGSEAALGKILGMVESLINGDLPSYLWWKGALHFEHPLFKHLSEYSTAVVVDSSQFMPEPEESIVALHSLLKQDIAVSDLNWRRLAPWQELTAEAFDAPERWYGLLEVDRVTIDYEQGNPSQALLFLGWLASRPHLEWEPVEVRSEGGEYDIHRVILRGKNGQTIEAELAALPTEPGEVLGDIADIRLFSTNPEANCGTILCSETMGCMRMEAGGKSENSYVQQVSPLNDQKAETLLSEQLRSWSRDRLFEESLSVAAQIAELSNSSSPVNQAVAV
jgi:glucose-6-phosphate dehydrogenase assembly protein OpcA